MKVKDLPNGAILWHNNTILGVAGCSLPKLFDDCECHSLPGNVFDYDLNPQSYTEEQMDYIKKLTSEEEE